MYRFSPALADGRRCSAPLTMLAANKHHAEARSTRNRRELGAAKLTLRRSDGASRAAIRTVKCFCLHRCLFYQFGGREK